MIKFRHVEITKTQEDAYFLEWEVFADSRFSGSSIGSYEFKLSWSFDPVSGFEYLKDGYNQDIVIDGAIGPLAYTDWKVQYKFNRDRWYKVEAHHKTNPADVVTSDTVMVECEWDGIVETIRYAEEVLYDCYIGNPVYILKRKSDGARCPDCWSAERYQITRTDCSTCNGTGFETGYYAPIQTQMQIDENPKISEVKITGETTDKTMRGRMSNYPIVRPRDMIVFEDTSKRFSVIRVDPTKLPNLAQSRRFKSRSNYIVSQILTLFEINPNDSEYKVPTDPATWGLIDTISTISASKAVINSDSHDNKNILGTGGLQALGAGIVN